MPILTDAQVEELKECCNAINADRREGVIEGLERALGSFPKPNSTTQWDPQEAIRAELERLKAEG